MFVKRISNFCRGQSVVELLIAMGLFAVFIPALATSLVTSQDGKAQQIQRLEATQLLEEIKESLRSVREKGWANVATDGNYHPVISGSSWSLVAGPTSISGFTQQITINPAYRDTNENLVATPGRSDPSSKLVTASVSWSQPYSSSVTSTYYLTRYLDNLSLIETNKVDFDAGAQTSLKSQLTGSSSTDGELILSQTGGFGDWCQPGGPIATRDLPKNGVGKAVSVIQGLAAAGTGENSSGVSFASIKITDPIYPTAPTTLLDGTFDGYKTNAVFNEPNKTDYAYLATDANSKEIVIVNLTSKDASNKYSEAGYFNAPGNGNGNSVYALGSVGYMTSGDKFYTFDLSSYDGSRPRPPGAKDLTLSGVGKKIFVAGGKAYVVTDATTNQLQIINVTDPANPTVINNISVPGSSGRDLYINANQSRAYVVTAKSATKNDFFVVDLTTNSPTGGEYNTGDMDPMGVVAVTASRAVVVGWGGVEYQVIKIENDRLNPLPPCGPGFTTGSPINGISTVFTHPTERAYSYIITDADPEFRIIEGGPGSSGSGDYVPTGTFISQPLPIPNPLVNPTAFNNFTANFTQPAGNDVQIYVSVASPKDGSCALADYTFVGVNGTSTPFQDGSNLATSISGPIPFGAFPPDYQNPNKCFKYKVVLNTSDPTQTPVFKEITVNYSP
jgi:type II secretory pathway pseudopilin PulG